MISSETMRNMTLVDGHVHIHDLAQIDSLLDSAVANFRTAGRTLGAASPSAMSLMLTEVAGAGCFETLKQRAVPLAEASDHRSSGWSFFLTEEASSILASSGSGERLSIIAGRQIVTAEGLEVLALATDQQFPDGEPIESTLERAAAAKAIVVLPWGFGKWLGRRRRSLRKVIESSKSGCLFLGDNSGRLRYLPVPSEFRIASVRGIRLLPGTDPLPLPSESDRVGSFGFAVSDVVSDLTPAQDLRRLIISERVDPLPYGRPEGLVRFLRNQVRMQLRKHLGG